MTRLVSLALLLAPLLALGGCAACESLEPLALPDEHCQPLLAGADCMLPYPSDFFRHEDASAPGGFVVTHEGSAQPITEEGYPADMNEWRPVDGFSRFTPILALLGEPVGAEGLTRIFDDRDATTSPDSPTLIVDAETGALVPHFADVDPRPTEAARRALVLRPEVALDESRRYVVAVQRVKTPDGADAAPPEGFRRLRDGRGADDPALGGLQQHYDDDVFPVLEAAGVDRASLQLAWDFTTGADIVVMDDLLRARELALAALAANPPVVTDVFVDEEEADPVWRTVFGTVTAPLVMERNEPGGALARDADGRVKLNGETTFTFTATIPHSVRDSFAPGPAMHFGHGFFGGQEEQDAPVTERLIEHLGTVSWAIDWVGMSGGDLGEVISTVGGDLSLGARFQDRVVQSMVNWLALTAALHGPLKQELAFQRPTDVTAPGVVEDPDNAGATNAGELVYDDAEIQFVGISMGHILGGVYVALNPDIRRAVLHAGGAGFAQMMFRAIPFERFLFIMDISLPDPLDQQKAGVLLQRHLDRVDPGLWAPFVRDRELPVGPSSAPDGREVLLQSSTGDTSVPNFASDLHARVLGLPLLTPTPRDVWGLEGAPLPHTGSGYTTFDLGVDDGFYVEAQFREDETLAHDNLRRHPEVLDQMRTFLRTGEIVDVCGGACVLEPVAVPEDE